MRFQDLKAGMIVKTRAGFAYVVVADKDGGPLFASHPAPDYARDDRGDIVRVEDTSRVALVPHDGSAQRFLNVRGLRPLIDGEPLVQPRLGVGGVRGALVTSVGSGMTISRKAAQREAHNAQSYVAKQIEEGTYVSPEESLRRTLARMNADIDAKVADGKSARGVLREKSIEVKHMLSEIITRLHMLDNSMDIDAMAEVFAHLDHTRSAVLSMWRGVRERSTQSAA